MVSPRSKIIGENVSHPPQNSDKNAPQVHRGKTAKGNQTPSGRNRSPGGPGGSQGGVAVERLSRATELETASLKQPMHAVVVLGEMATNACCKPGPRLAIDI